MTEPFHTAVIIAASAVAGITILPWAILRWQERAAWRRLERALYPEITALRLQAAALAAELTRRQEAQEGFGAAFFACWRLSAPLIYPATGTALGLLRGDGLDRVGAFHAVLADARDLLAEARVAQALPQPHRLLGLLLRACHHVEPWVTALEPRFGPIIGGYPDLREASRLLERLEEGNPVSRAYAWCWVEQHPSGDEHRI